MKRTGALKIGNVVCNSNGFEMYVTALFNDDTVYLDFDGNEGDVWDEKVVDLKGVYLSNELLLKYGFVKTDRGYFVHYKDMKTHCAHLRVANTMGNWFVSIGEDKHGIILGTYNFLHELQNLFYSINNEELTNMIATGNN